MKVLTLDQSPVEMVQGAKARSGREKETHGENGCSGRSPAQI